MSGLIRHIAGWFRNVRYRLSGTEREAYSETVRELRYVNFARGRELADLARRYENLEASYRNLEGIKDPTTIQMLQGQLNASREEVERYRQQVNGFAKAAKGQQEQVTGLYKVINETGGLVGHLKRALRDRREDRFNDCRLLARLIDRYISPSFLIGPDGDVQWAGRRAKRLLGDIVGRKYYDVLKMRKQDGSQYKKAEIIEFFSNPRMQDEVVSIVDSNSQPVDAYMLKRPMFYRQQQIGDTTRTEGKHDITFGVLVVEDVLQKRLEFFDKIREVRKRQEERINIEKAVLTNKAREKSRCVLIEAERMQYEQHETLEDIQSEAILEDQKRTLERSTMS